MAAERRAVIFDLDDTLYPIRRFVVSGFGVVARHLEAELGMAARDSMRVLVRATRLERGVEIQALLRVLGLRASLLPELVALIRNHTPRLSLPRRSAAVLHALRRDVRVGIVTNGDPAMQQRKLQALGLGDMVDAVTYAHAEGSREGKPDPVPFEVTLSRLGVESRDAVFVGDDERRDIGGAARVGMRTIRAAWYAGYSTDQSTAADAVLHSIAEVPAVASRLMELRRQ